MRLPRRARVTSTLPLALVLIALVLPAAADLMIVGNDQKVVFDAEGNRSFVAPGKDSIVVVDLASRESPRIVASFPLMNSIFGPPTNLAVTPDERLALVANSVNWVQDGAAWKPAPDNKLYVFDLKASPPVQIATVEVGRQPSGLAINARGDLALITNRADKSISVVSIQGKDVKLVDTVPMGDEVAAVAITPDGKRALVVKFPAHKVAVLDIDGQKVTYNNKLDMPVGQWPYNVDITPNGRIAITADNGNSGAPDGHVDTVSVIDLEVTPPRVIDRVVVGDAPEGFVISPKGDVAVAVLLGGASALKSAWFNTKRNGSVAVLKIDGKKVTKVGEVEVGGLPEGAVFSPDGRYLYVGNYVDSDVSILKVDGSTITDTGKKLKLPGQPASMRGRAR
ncbi:MAG TPA: YncE family protein [Candidatus Acidoferrum sp.]|jgi:DNA-binding beta-propeller fold protein YncE|nr:YncE family protein [Candidatus Acidoferrum sp.]